MQSPARVLDTVAAIDPRIFVSSRVTAMKIAPTIAMAERAAALRQAGVNVIGLAVGEPDFDTPDHIIQAAFAAARRGFTRYTAPDGSLLVKDAVRAKLQRDNGLTYARDEVHVASGCKQVIYNAFAATLDPGDEVVVFTPSWVSYIEVVEFCGGRPVLVETKPDKGFLPDLNDLRHAMSEHTKWVVINTPNNPTGAIYPAELLSRIAEIVFGHPKALILSDEIYEHLVFDGAKHVCLLEAAPHMRERVLLVNGVSKSYAMTGWRIGFGAGPRWLIEAMAKVQSQTAGSSSSVGQAAAAAAMMGDQSRLDEWRCIVERRRDCAVEILCRSNRLVISVPRGAFYLFADVSGCIGARCADGTVLSDDIGVAEYLLAEARVATVPGAAFGATPFIRVSFALEEEQLAEACERIVSALERLQGPSESSCVVRK